MQDLILNEMLATFYVKDNEFVSQNDLFQDISLTGQIIYEVIRVIDGKILFLEDHIGRFKNSAAKAKIPILPDKIIIERIAALIKKNELKNGNIKFLFQINEENKITFYALIIPHYYPSEKEYSEGIKLILFTAERTDPSIKQMHTGLKIRIDKAVTEKGAFEALLLHPNGYITEGSKSNFFLIKNNIVYTSPEEYVLPGVTRKNLMRLFTEFKIQCIESQIAPVKLNTFDAAFISGTSPKVLPVKIINEYIFNPHYALLQQIIKLYNAQIENYLNNTVKFL